ncbi:MAG: glutamate-5-semialdehyde dehydrogenase [Clostridia bacterium]|nr:glutamate-5-semialdehyde dehydrogenase [Clostridia bacterium]
MDKDVEKIARDIKLNSAKLANSTGKLRNQALAEVQKALWINREHIFDENKKDLISAQNSKLPESIMKRLLFDEKKLQTVLAGIDDLIKLPDPLGQILLKRELDANLTLTKISCPIGVIGVIFESRPDALVQIATLCLKSGNCALMKGGSEATNSNRALYRVIKDAAVKAGIQNSFLTLLEDRKEIDALLSCEHSIDLLIPRGSNEFVSYIMDHTKIPVMGHAAGVCHVYVDAYAQIEKAVSIIIDSKLQYVVVCNAAETLLVHENIAHEFLPAFVEGLKGQDLEIRGDSQTQSIIRCIPLQDNDLGTEFGDKILAVKVVKSAQEAVDHINRYSSKHTDAIVTENKQTAELFLKNVDSASVMHNCSTRFADGFRYGFGAEVGISTGKLHARGPVGLEGLTTYKYIVAGDGHIVADYNEGRKSFNFKNL